MQRSVCFKKDTLLRDVKLQDAKFGDPRWNSSGVKLRDLKPEEEFLDEIQTKVLRVFLLAVHNRPHFIFSN
jgi:hypothetical protein